MYVLGRSLSMFRKHQWHVLLMTNMFGDLCGRCITVVVFISIYVSSEYDREIFEEDKVVYFMFSNFFHQENLQLR